MCESRKLQAGRNGKIMQSRMYKKEIKSEKKNENTE